MSRINSQSVTAQLGGKQMSAEFSDQTGQLCIRQDGMLVREWFPPHSWIAIASVAGARNWGTRPSADELMALLENQAVLLQTG